ncbi:phage tail assembly protein [Microvirga calopogonii]|uniref:phage tail assembly protein n=1 Tax=Microvirga calopogonii TaxID=2078013 RepID=UPI003CCA917C
MFPVVIDGAHYTEFWVRPAEPEDLAGLRWGDSLEARLERGMTLVARMCDVPEAVLYALDPSDAGRLGTAVEGLISGVV